MANAFTKPSPVMENVQMILKNVEVGVLLQTAGTPLTTEAVETNVSTNTTNAMENVPKDTHPVETIAVYKNPPLRITSHAAIAVSGRVNGHCISTGHVNVETLVCIGESIPYAFHYHLRLVYNFSGPTLTSSMNVPQTAPVVPSVLRSVRLVMERNFIKVPE
jgi:riboflavin synthase alpha subunit